MGVSLIAGLAGALTGAGSARVAGAAAGVLRTAADLPALLARCGAAVDFAGVGVGAGVGAACLRAGLAACRAGDFALADLRVAVLLPALVRADFLTAAFFAGVFLAAVFLADVFFATDVVAAFFGAAFLVADFFGAAFRVAAFFGAAFLVAVFLATDFVAVLRPVDFAADFLAGAFFVADFFAALGRVAAALAGALRVAVFAAAGLAVLAAVGFFTLLALFAAAALAELALPLPLAAPGLPREGVLSGDFFAADFFADVLRDVAMRSFSCGSGYNRSQYARHAVTASNQEAGFQNVGCVSALRKYGSTRGSTSTVTSTPYAAPHKCALWLTLPAPRRSM